MQAENSSAITEDEYCHGVRVVVLHLPEDEGEGLGFRLTRTLWDPYPWVQGNGNTGRYEFDSMEDGLVSGVGRDMLLAPSHLPSTAICAGAAVAAEENLKRRKYGTLVREVTLNSRADAAGLKTGDCLLQADGNDLLGMPVGQVAGLIRGDGASHGVSLLVWNCGVDPKDDPELLWSCGGGYRGEKSRRALANVVKALACSVCASTATKPMTCARSHIYCEPCWVRLERCALCRELLPSKASPYARNLVAEQVFEAIANEYELKSPSSKPLKTTSAYTSPQHSPNVSPSPHRRGQYQHSMLKHKKKLLLTEKFGQSYASDPNIHRSLNTETRQPNPTILVENSDGSNSTSNGGNLSCQSDSVNKNLLTTSDVVNSVTNINSICSNSSQCLCIPHKLVAKLRPACSLADLQNVTVNCQMSKSLNNLGDCKHDHHGSLDNFKNICVSNCDSPVYLLPAPPIYVVTCDHNRKE